MSAKIGYIYLMTNVAMPDLVKVGCSTNNPIERARQLSASTSSALPFTLVYSRCVADPFKIEASLHSQLDAYRINDSREFFRVPLHKVIVMIEKYQEMKDTTEYPFAELFATFEDDGSDRELTEDERAKCRELESRLNN